MIPELVLSNITSDLAIIFPCVVVIPDTSKVLILTLLFNVTWSLNVTAPEPNVAAPVWVNGPDRFVELTIFGERSSITILSFSDK